MAGAWEFVDRALTDDRARTAGHGPAMQADAESHSIALATFGALIFEWDAVSGRIARPAGLHHLYGYSVEDIEPTVVWLRDLIHPDDLVRDRGRFLAQVTARAPIIRGHYRVRHRDGRWISVKTAGAAEYDRDGRLLRLVGCTMDTDEATILEEAHARLAAVVRHSSDAIFSADASGLVLTWNEGATKLYGFDAEEIVGKPLTTLVPEGESAESKRAFEDVLSGETRVFQAMRKRRDGTSIAVEISEAPIRSPTGRVLGLSTIHRDVTKARQTALADARFAAVVGASHDAIITLDVDGRIESWNRGAEELFGWPASEAVGRLISFIVPDDLRREYDTITRRISAGETVISETERVARNGARVSVAASYSPFVDDGAFAGSAVTFRDIGDRLAREKHVTVLLKELSHRSKNLLAVVQGIARQSGIRSSDFTQFLDNFSARLRALAHAHDLIVQEDWHGADMHALVAMQTGAFEIGEGVVKVEGDRLLVRPEAAQNIGLSLHELASNAIRHGALSVPGGHVAIGWGFFDNAGKRALRVSWREFGGPPAQLPKRGGFGILVLTQIAPRALAGQARLSADADGLSWVLEVPENVVSRGLA